MRFCAAIGFLALVLPGAPWARRDSRGGVTGPIDLLKRIHPERDGYKGIWTLRNGILRVDPDSDRWSQLDLPLTYGTEYELHLVATREEPKAMMVLGLPAGGRTFSVELGGGKDGEASILSGARGMAEQKHQGALFPLGTAVSIVCSVRKGRLIVIVGDVRIFDWTGDPQTLGMASPWREQYSGSPLLGTRGLFEFSRMALTVCEGKTEDTVRHREDRKARAIREAYEEQLRRERQEVIIRPASDR